MIAHYTVRMLCIFMKITYRHCCVVVYTSTQILFCYSLGSIFSNSVQCYISGCYYQKCLDKCLNNLSVTDNSTTISALYLPVLGEEWTVMVSVTCRLPRETVIGNSSRTCHCGNWDESEVVCKREL